MFLGEPVVLGSFYSERESETLIFQGNLWYLGAFTVKEKLSSLINGTYVKDNPGLLEHPVCNIIIDFSRVSKVDSTALDKIKEVCLNYLLRNVPRSAM